MRKQRILDEAFALRLEAFVVDELDHMVHYRTGEILDSRHYTAQTWKPQDEPPNPTFDTLTSVNQRNTFLDSLDKRRLKLFNGCLGLYDRDKGNAFLTGAPIRLSTSTYKKMDQLVKLIDYRNLIIESPSALARRLGVRLNHLHRHLSSLEPLVKVCGARQGMAKGTLKVAISPAYGFRYQTSSLDAARQDAVVLWYRNAIMQ